MAKSIKLKNNMYIDKSSIDMYPGYIQADGLYSTPVTLDRFSGYCQAKLGSKGWYKIFKISNRDCIEGNSFILQLHSYYNNSNSSSYIIAGSCAYRQGRLVLLSKKNLSNIFTDVRVIADSSRGVYIEVYYNETVENIVCATITGYNSALTKYDFVLDNSTPATTLASINLKNGLCVDEQKSAIVVALNDNTSLTFSNSWSKAKVPFNTVWRSIGNRLSLDDYGNVIYTGSRPLKVSCLITVSSATGSIYPRIFDNDGNTSGFQEHGGSSGAWRCELITQRDNYNSISVLLSSSAQGSVHIQGTQTYTYLLVEEM